MSIPYSNLTDSGINWVGKFPEHWKLEPLKNLVRLRNGFPFDSKAFTEQESDANRLIRIRDILKNGNKTYTKQGCPHEAYVHNGDLLIGMDGDFNFKLWTEGKAKLNQRVCALNASTHQLQKFVYYSLAFPLKIINDLTYSTTVKHLSSDQVLKTRLPVPTEPELKKIVAFLDYETAKIDALIDEQKRLIDLLKEKRQAVISHAVTKGLNPDAPMKDSGVEWLEEVPEHWRVSPLRYATKFQEGPGILAKDFKDDGIPLIRISGVQGNEVTTSGCNFLDPELVSKKWKHFRLNKGDLVISGSASMELVSEVTKETQGSILYTGLIRINSVNRVTQKSFIKVFLASKMFFTQIDMLKAGSTIQHFGPSHLNQMRIVIPPLHEQQEIADYVNHQIQRFESLIKQAQRQTKLLQERRSALISAAVTGKIDVRDWQPPAGSDTVTSNASVQTERHYG